MQHTWPSDLGKDGIRSRQRHLGSGDRIKTAWPASGHLRISAYI